MTKGIFNLDLDKNELRGFSISVLKKGNFNLGTGAVVTKGLFNRFEER